MQLQEIQQASMGNAALRRALQYIMEWGTAIEGNIGFTPDAAANTTATAPKKIQAPPLATFTVTGNNGQYLISITNPAGFSGTILHEIKAATTAPVGASTDIIIKGPAPDLNVAITDPNTTRYIQIRSKFAASGYNQPQVSQAVSSGAITATSLPTMFTPAGLISGAPILFQPDTAATIDISPSVFNMGSGVQVAYQGGMLSADANGLPLTYQTYYVYTDDPAKAGGLVTYEATTDASQLTANDGRISFGFITLVSSGGGIGGVTNFNTWPGVPAGSLITLMTGGTAAVESLVVGSQLKGVAGLELVVAVDMLPGVPCFTYTANGGQGGTVSSTQRLQMGDGGIALAMNLNVNDRLNTTSGDTFVTSKVFAGVKAVYRLRLSSNHFYLADGVWSRDAN